MAQSITKIQTALMRDYYRYFSKYSKGKAPDNKVAWITAFTPVEILQAFGIVCCYPESYAAVIAASGKEQPLLEKSEICGLSLDCCSYSCCIEGCLETGDAPRGTPPRPDILIATNNQCNTLPNWWNILAERYNVPLIVLDYPGEFSDRKQAYDYVTAQHKNLIFTLEELTGNKIDMMLLEELILNSEKSVAAWNKIISFLPEKEIKPTVLFDDINYLITARCNPLTSQLYEMIAEELAFKPDADKNLIPLFWLGYPLWYHSERYLPELLEGFRVAGSNYITWWSLDYSGDNIYERLFQAYNYTFLNLAQKTRNARLTELIRASKSEGAVTLHNKSCKCDFVSAKNVDIPQAELEIDMIDRHFLAADKAKKQIELLRETICTRRA